jgi:hypothetical protein
MLLLPIISMPAARAETLSIVANGRSRYAIAFPDDADPGRIAKATGLLQTVILQATGAKLPVVRESALPEGTPALFVGRCVAAREAGLPMDDAQGWAFLNQVRDKNIFLMGAAADAGVKGRKDIEHLGAMKAVTRFLEDHGGVRFILPSRDGMYVPELDLLTVDAGMRVHWKPRFEYVTGRTTRDRAYAVANNFFGRSPVVFHTVDIPTTTLFLPRSMGRRSRSILRSSAVCAHLPAITCALRMGLYRN